MAIKQSYIYLVDEDHQLAMMKDLISEYQLEDMVKISNYTKSLLWNLENQKPLY